MHAGAGNSCRCLRILTVLYLSACLTQTMRKATLTFVLELSRPEASEARMHTVAQALLDTLASLGWLASGGRWWGTLT